MIKYHSFKAEHIILSLAIFVTGALFGIYTSQAAEPIIFPSSLTGVFPTIESNYSSIYFNYGGNDFAGMFLRTTGTTLSGPEVLSISGGTQTISCSQRINGIYYNNQRGSRIWPLDTESLQLLRNAYSGYDSLQISTGGLYTNCVAGAGGYTPNTNDVYGQITHTQSGTTFQLIAGMNYDFTSNSITGTSFGGTLKGPIASGFVFDSYGGIGYVGGTGAGTMLLTNTTSDTSICSGFTIATTPIPQGYSNTFTCYANTASGNVVTGYNLLIYSGSNSIYGEFSASSAASYAWFTGNALPAGSYTATCTILGSGNGAGTQCTMNSSFVVTGSQTTSGGNCEFQGNMTIITVPGTVALASNDLYYSRTTGVINIQLRSTIPSYYTVSSSGMTNMLTGNYLYSYNYNPLLTPPATGVIYLTTGEGAKQINTTFTANGCTYQAYPRQIMLDLLPPTTSTSMSPTNGNGICYVGESTFSWTGANDAGVGITTYNYKIYSNAAMTTSVLNGTTTGNAVSINASTLGTGYYSGTYYRSVQAIDGLGQTGGALTGMFKVGIEYCTNSGNIMIHGTIPRLRNADLNKEYLSDPFTVDGLPGRIIASLSTGILYVNGTGNASTGYVNNGDELNIKLRSSTQYDTTVSSIFYIGPRYATFHITTKSLTGYTPASGCVLETGQKLIIQNIFDMMKDTYSADQGTLADFLFTIQSMLQDETDLTNNCSLEYLLNTVDSYIMDNLANAEADESTHKAPNCKEYAIKFVSSRSGYTSPNFKRKKTYFSSREALIRFIDANNPGDCNINTYGDLPEIDNSELSGYYTAPNGKQYQIKDKEGSGTTLYYSPEFIKVQYFENEDDLFKFIDTNNPTIEIREHEVDQDFDPEIHTAPNGKEYKIYGTDQGFMSYKLMKVQYFDTLEEIKAYIDKNNKQ